MNNIKLLSIVLKRTNTLIKSEEYKEAYRIDNSFSRKRKLPFSNTVYFICSALENVSRFVFTQTYSHSHNF